MIKKNVSVEKLLQKIKHYCAYQERSHYETREKLYSFGLSKQAVESMLTQLITEDFLNEERFACSFARGKMRIKHWGKVKIKYELKQRRVSDYNIKTALKQLDESEYIAILQKLVSQKWEAFKTEVAFARQAKTVAYLLQKGFELPLVQAAIKNCGN